MSDKLKHDAANRGDPTRRAHGSSRLSDMQRCRHPCKKLMIDGNRFWCDSCQRIVGFVHLPTARKPA